jgi:hypothetical protein
MNKEKNKKFNKINNLLDIKSYYTTNSGSNAYIYSNNNTNYNTNYNTMPINIGTSVVTNTTTRTNTTTLGTSSSCIINTNTVSIPNVSSGYYSTFTITEREIDILGKKFLLPYDTFKFLYINLINFLGIEFLISSKKEIDNLFIYNKDIMNHFNKMIRLSKIKNLKLKEKNII